MPPCIFPSIVRTEGMASHPSYAVCWRHGNVSPARLNPVNFPLTSNFSFLNDMERITERRYVPTDGSCALHIRQAHLTFCTLISFPCDISAISDDVLRARLKTLGVVEHHFALDRGAEKGVDWRICELPPRTVKKKLMCAWNRRCRRGAESETRLGAILFGR